LVTGSGVFSMTNTSLNAYPPKNCISDNLVLWPKTRDEQREKPHVKIRALYNYGAVQNSMGNANA
jgi:hypothetical protein